VVDVLARAEAVAKVRPSADFESHLQCFQAHENILRQACEAGKQPAATLNVLALQELAEKDIRRNLAEMCNASGLCNEH